MIALVLRERPVEQIRYVMVRGRNYMRTEVRTRRHLRVPEDAHNDAQQHAPGEVNCGALRRALMPRLQLARRL